MIKVENLTKSFIIHILNEKVISGFRNISFSVSYGSSLGISGPSGTGKSSILKCIYRTYIPTTGKIWFHSQDYGIIDLARIDESKMIQIREKEIGYISQFLKVIPRVPAIDIVSEPLLESGVPEGEARKMARDLLMRLRVPSNLYDAYPSTFSGGEQQRINIARAIIKKPRLLLLDEPTASLDQMSKKIVLRIFKELKEQGCTMIGIFHEKEILKKFSDQILTLHENGHYDIE